MKNTLFGVTLSVLFFAGCANEITYEKVDGYNLVYQSRGATLGYTSSPILTVDGFAFKDLNRNGALDLYEDWRLTPEERAKDLASKLPVDAPDGTIAVPVNPPSVTTSTCTVGFPLESSTSSALTSSIPK